MFMAGTRWVVQSSLAIGTQGQALANPVLDLALIVIAKLTENTLSSVELNAAAVASQHSCNTSSEAPRLWVKESLHQRLGFSSR
jgi:hypothetical protein